MPDIERLHKEGRKLRSQIQDCITTIAQNYDELQRLTNEAVREGGIEFRNFTAGGDNLRDDIQRIMELCHDWYTWGRFA